MPDYRYNSTSIDELASMLNAAQRNNDSNAQKRQFAQKQSLEERMPSIEEQSQEKLKQSTLNAQEGLTQKHLQQAQDIIANQAKAGRKVNAKINENGVDISQSEESPLKYTFHNQQKDNDATSKAYTMYAQGLTKLKQGVDSSKEGLDAVSDPSQIGSVGIVRSNILRSMGMNRYNEQEASKSMPPALQQYAKTLFTGATSGWDGQNVKSGDDNNPMTPEQKAAAVSFFRGHIQNALQQHEVLKNTARGYLRASGHYNPQTASILEDGLKNSGFEEYANGIIQPKPDAKVTNQVSPLPKNPAPQQQQEGGFWSKVFGKSQPQSGMSGDLPDYVKKELGQ